MVNRSPVSTPRALPRVVESTRPEVGSSITPAVWPTTRLSRGLAGRPRMAVWREREPLRRRAGTVRKGSDSRTPGRRSSSWRAAADVGSTKVVVTSCSITSSNCTFMMSLMASTKKKPKTRRAMAKAIPVAERRVRTGRRPRLRRIIRAGSESSPARPALPSHRPASGAERKLAGGSGRIASAGGSRTARRTAPKAPIVAAPRLTASAATTIRGESEYWNSGKRKYSL